METNGIIVIGSLNTDLSFFTDIIPNAGETVMGQRFLLGCGGKGANQCVACALLGGETVGTDYFGNLHIERLKNIGVNTEGIKQSETLATGVASIIINNKLNTNEIVVVPGANMSVLENDISSSMDLFVKTKRVLICQFEINANATLFGLKLAHERGLITILNPAPAPSPMLDSNGKTDDYELFLKMLPYSDFVCPNEFEALNLMGGDPKTINFDTDENRCINICISCLSWLAGCGVRWPIVTLGKRGVLALLDYSDLNSKDPNLIIHKHQISIKNDKKMIIQLIAPTVVDVVDTSGAGDCFIGALGYFVAYHQNISLMEQLKRSMWVASQSIRKSGTQNSYPKRKDLSAAMFSKEPFVGIN